MEWCLSAPFFSTESQNMQMHFKVVAHAVYLSHEQHLVRAKKTIKYNFSAAIINKYTFVIVY